MNYKRLQSLDDVNDQDFGLFIIKSFRFVLKIFYWSQAKASSIF